MKLFSLKNEFIVTLQKKKKKSPNALISQEILGAEISPRNSSWTRILWVDFEAEAPSRGGSWTLQLPRVDPSVLSLCFPHSLMAPHHCLG